MEKMVPPMRWLVFAGLLPLSFMARAAEMCEVTSGTNVVPLVELYTAEGCSDCPPADVWLSKLAEEADPQHTSVLAFHVDYWDAVGWPDRFADAKYTQRQQARIKIAHKKVVYTPQVMIGKDTAVNWREEGRVDGILRRAEARPGQVDLTLRVLREQDVLRVGVKASRAASAEASKSPAFVWLALYQDGLTSEIRAGENKGRTLHHDRVVVALQGPWRLDTKPTLGEVRIPLPEKADPERLGLVLFVESEDNGDGLQSVNLPFSRCLP